jgi:hypothetical protein
MRSLFLTINYQLDPLALDAYFLPVYSAYVMATVR